MPELPEVQTIADDLNKRIVGRTIVGVWYNWPKTIKSPKASQLGKQIKGSKILRVSRRAKNVLIYLNGNKLLLIHQKMTGHLLVGKWEIKKAKTAIPADRGPLGEKVNSYIHLIFYLDNGRMLGLSDARKFAKVLFGQKDEIEQAGLNGLGPEPLDKNLTCQKFKRIILGKKNKIKIVLMDQAVIAGIGNIYSDEILYLAKIHPLKRANALSDKELEGLYSAMKKILKKALKLRGVSLSDFRDTFGKPGGYGKSRLVYRREGERCSRSNGIIKRIKIGDRSAHYCPRCQKV